MVKKKFIYLVISLFAISILFSGCSSSNLNDNNKMPTQQAKVVSDTPAVVPVVAPAPAKNVVDSSFNNDANVTNSDVEIGSLI